MPEDGGYYIWVRRGMGRFWGFQEAWLSLVGSVFDMAIYPTLFVSYLAHFVPAMMAGQHATWIGVGLIMAAAAWNMLGAKTVGGSSMVMGVLLLSPFAVLAAASVFHGGMFAARPAAPRHADILGGVLVAMWNYMGWDNTSTVAGEVENPQRTYPRAMAGAVALVALGYVLPIGAVALTGLDASRWETGGWADVARAVLGTGAVGVVVALGITAGGMLGAAGSLNALTMALSRVPAALAEDGFLPRIFARRDPKTDAPRWAIARLCRGLGARPDAAVQQASHARHAAHWFQHFARIRCAGCAAHSRASACAALPRSRWHWPAPSPCAFRRPFSCCSRCCAMTPNRWALSTRSNLVAS